MNTNLKADAVLLLLVPLHLINGRLGLEGVASVLPPHRRARRPQKAVAGDRECHVWCCGCSAGQVRCSCRRQTSATGAVT